MRKILVLTLAAMVLTAGAATAQMMGGGMMGGYAPPPAPQQAHVAPGYGMYPGMMGYGGTYPNMMGPGMMGYGGSYGMMNPGMMGYGGSYGMMNPGMMGYGGAYPNMTGLGVTGMVNPGMMGYGGAYGMMNPGMMGYGAYPGQAVQGPEAAGKKFLDETVELRKKVHVLMFEYTETSRDPKADPAKLAAKAKEIQDLQQQIFEKWREAVK